MFHRFGMEMWRSSFDMAQVREHIRFSVERWLVSDLVSDDVGSDVVYRSLCNRLSVTGHYAASLDLMKRWGW